MPTSHKIEASNSFSAPRRLFFRVLRLFFHFLYHQFSWTYDFVAWVVSLGNWEQWVKAVVPYLDGPKILEIGFGPGHLQLALQHKHASIYGIDESAQMVHITRKRLVEGGFHPSLIQGDAIHLPLANQSLDQVVLTFPAEFMLDPLTLSEISRVLIDGGSALFIPVAWITGRSPLARLAAWVNRITGEAPQWDPNVLTPLEQSGFDVHWEMINFPGSKVLLVRLAKN